MSPDHGRTHPRRAQGDDGVVAGLDGVLIGVLVIVALTLAATNLWTVLDARAAVGEASAAAARAYAEADLDPAGAATAAARQVLAEHHREALSITVESDGFSRCAPVEIVVVTEVPRLSVPGFDGPGRFQISSTHRTLVDPYRSSASLNAAAACG